MFYSIDDTSMDKLLSHSEDVEESMLRGETLMFLLVQLCRR